MNKLERMQLFLDVAATGSMSKIAQKKGVSVAAISKKICALEAHLQVSLFHRAHRRMNLTPIGESYLKQCQKIMESIQESEQLIATAQKEPIGTLRISCGSYFSERFILPHLNEFLSKYPVLNVEITIADPPPNLKAGETDLIFGTTLQHMAQDLICRKVTLSQYVLCASPQYLHNYGPLKNPTDLAQHRYITNQDRQPDNTLQFGHQRIVLKPFLKLNDAHAMVNAALNHLGIVNLNRYIVQPLLDQQQLIEILPEHALDAKPVYLFYRKSDYLEPKVRCFIDFFLEKISVHAES